MGHLTGYPLGFLATWALTLRCSLVLITAWSLRPVEEHDLEKSTRELFNVHLALRLCDFSWESYVGMPKPAAVVISGCGHKELNGTYFQET
ncbi:unnamed protein product [Effrenium voratum]|nr:unnamed protein product [Effrenium voratum]